jgi:murein DD-endopeptidase MepM/ murein hydrolase activator NlpD
MSRLSVKVPLSLYRYRCDMANFKNPIGSGLTPERVDMGVDFGGSGPLYALGHGQITQVYGLGGGSGWPGGGWIGLKLDDGREMYYAEDISPVVHAGQTVQAGQLIGHATGGSSGIELGWASGSGTGTEAAALGQNKLGLSHGDPGAYPTAMGVDMANLIHSLGGPLGIIKGAIQGTLPKNWQAAPGSPASASTTGISLPGILGFPTEITGFFHDAKAFIDALLWIVNPASWLRIGSFMVGVLLILFAIYALMKVGSDEPLFKLPQVVPVPV